LAEAEVLIKIEYIGFFKIATKKTIEEIRVPTSIAAALEKINRFLQDNYQIDKNLTILINSQSVSVFKKNNHQLKKFTKFTIIPSLSGG
jgi:molybdopterin converting factor small subunit